MTSAGTPSVAVSAPGKVLLAGGYLVLDRQYTGLVFGLSARIHVAIRRQPTASGSSPGEIIVRSPQFTGAVWKFECCSAGEVGAAGDDVQVRSLDESRNARNPFVETALAYTLAYLCDDATAVRGPLAITILADRDYYSSPSNPATAMDTASGHNAAFLDFGVPLADAHKTGLGSSAALVTALTAALFRFYAPDEFVGLLEDERGRARLHNLAQVVHSAAQGKVGSGFDVAAAIYGSCLYRRFSPAIINDLQKPGSPGFAKDLRRLVESGPGGESRWDNEIVKNAAKMPRSLRLVLCDVDCGTATVGMVKAVLAWRHRCMEESAAIWQELNQQNKRLGELLVTLADLESETPHIFDEALSLVLGGDGDLAQAAPIRQKLSEVEETLLAIRRLIRKMSGEAGVPIEPAPQTDLLDACSALPGVLGGVVPGAGGYDAIALLVVDRQRVLERLSTLCSNWKGAAGSAAGAMGGRVHMLGVREEVDGVRAENETLYGGWLC